MPYMTWKIALQSYIGNNRYVWVQFQIIASSSYSTGGYIILTGAPSLPILLEQKCGQALDMGLGVLPIILHHFSVL